MILELGRRIPSLDHLDATTCIKDMSAYVPAILKYPFYKKPDESLLLQILTDISSSDADEKECKDC